MSIDHKSEVGVCPVSLDEIDFSRQDIQNCPYPTYALMREQAPVWRDPTGAFHVTSYELLREVLRDSTNFLNSGSVEAAQKNKEKMASVRAVYEKKGWVPTATIAQMDDPQHRGLRQHFEKAFHAGKVREMVPLIESVADDLIDSFLDKGGCDWVAAFSVPLPLVVLLRQSGIPLEEGAKIRHWADDWVRHHLSFMQSDDEAIASAELETQRQHYFQPIFERLRREPDGSLISELANNVVPEWDRKLTDEELHTAIGVDLLVAGNETTTNAISQAMRLLIKHPDVWEKLKADPEKYVRPFVEEVLRLEAPAQALYRRAANDVELGGVTIPKDATVVVRYGAANRDPDQFESPDSLNLDRRNAGSHMTFGSGLHHCVGASLSRTETQVSVRAVLKKFSSLRFAPDRNDFSYEPSRSLRALRHLHIEFQPA